MIPGAAATSDRMDEDPIIGGAVPQNACPLNAPVSVAGLEPIPARQWEGRLRHSSHHAIPTIHPLLLSIRRMAPHTRKSAF